MGKLEDLKAKVLALQEWERKATPGIWRRVPPDEHIKKEYISREIGCKDVPPEKFYVAVFGMKKEPQARDIADCALIVDMRNAAPQLLQAFLLMAEVVTNSKWALTDGFEEEGQAKLINALKALDGFLVDCK